MHEMLDFVDDFKAIPNFTVNEVGKASHLMLR